MSTGTELNAEPQILTDKQLIALPQRSHRYEIIKGEVVNMRHAGALHGYICSLLLAALVRYISTKKLGIVLDSSTAFRMQNGNYRSPDVSFFAKDRLADLEELPTDCLEGAPDLAVEVIASGDSTDEIHQKLVEYFQSGTKLAWVIYPTENFVLVYRSAQEPDRLLKSTDDLDGEDVIPRFKLPVAELFQKLQF
ncbi:MAG: Uma2 family endonuclease [Pseudanabaenaceae cyanobacterium]